MTTTADIPIPDQKTSAQDTVVVALATTDGPVTVTELTAATGLSRSSVAVALTALETAGRAQRRRGERTGGRPAPDRWARTSTDPTDDPATTGSPQTTTPGTVAVDADAAATATPGTAGPAPDDSLPAVPTTTPIPDAEPAPDGDPAVGSGGDRGDDGPPDGGVDTPTGPAREDGDSGDGDVAVPADGGQEATVDGQAAATDLPPGEQDGDGDPAGGVPQDEAVAGGQERAPAGGVPRDEETATLAAAIVDAVKLVAACAQVCPSARCPLQPGRVPRDRRRPVAEPTANSDGQPRMRPGELTQTVLRFLRDHPEGTFTAPEIAREIGRSSGAIGNALDNLSASGDATLLTGTPRRYQAT